MRKVFLDDLPHHGKFIDWENCKGIYVNFIYDELDGKILIKDILLYNNGKKKLLLEYNGIERIMSTDPFKNANLGALLNKIHLDYVFNIGDVITDDKKDIIIIDRKIINNRRYYKFRCNKCGCESDYIFESKFTSKSNEVRCSACGKYKSKLVVGFNDIETTDPWVIDFLVDKNDACKYMSSQSKKILMRCPYCNKEKFVSICQLKRDKKISCECNSRIVSYPERIMLSVLKQLDINYIYQFSPKWANNRRYDFYLPDLNTIIETDGGLGHGNKNYRNPKMTPIISKQIDEYKNDLAYDNNIDLIRIDCKINEFEYIKDNIIKSKLSSICNINSIDWDKCEMDSIKNEAFEICKFKNEHPYMQISDIAKQFNIDRNSIRKYLNDGTKFGWCFYDKNFEFHKQFAKICVNKKYYFSSRDYLVEKSVEIFGFEISRYYIQKNLNKTVNGLYIETFYNKEHYYRLLEEHYPYIYDKYMDTFNEQRVFGI